MLARLFTSGELKIKIAAAEEMCPDQMNLLKTIRFLARTAILRAENIGSNISGQFRKPRQVVALGS